MGARQVLVVKPKDGTVKDGWASAKATDIVAHLPRTSEEKIVVGLLMGQVDITTLPLPASTCHPVPYKPVLSYWLNCLHLAGYKGSRTCEAQTT